MSRALKTFTTLWRKELGSYFLSPIAYVTTIFFLVVMGLSFWILVYVVLTEGAPGIAVLQELFSGFFYWLALLIVIPVITMRLFADEKRSGTMELLMTAPVTDTSIVLAKYGGALCFFVMMWGPTVGYFFILQKFSPLTSQIDVGSMLGGYLGAFLTGAFFISLGTFSSSLTSNQIIAAIIGFALISTVFFCGLLSELIPNESLREAVSYLSSWEHMSDFARGAVDTRPIVYYLSGTSFMLFASIKVLESRRWQH